MTDFTLDERLHARPAFDSWGRPGLFKSIVLAQWEKERDIEIDAQALIESYKQFSAHGVAAFIVFLLSEDGADIVEFGSGTVAITSPPDGTFTFEEFVSLQEIYIGDPKRGITPLAWLTYLSRSLSSLDATQLRAFDAVIGSIGLSIARILSGDYDLVPDDDLED